MLSPPKSRCVDQPIAVSLEDLVPANHFYRHLEAKLERRSPQDLRALGVKPLPSQGRERLRDSPEERGRDAKLAFSPRADQRRC